MKKQLYNLLNTLEAHYRHHFLQDDKGLLHFKEDPRDKKFIGSGQVRGMVDYGYRFHQRNNICVFASRELGRSQQDGVRWSVRFMVKLARREGMTSRDGFSYLRAANELAEKYGRLPYVLMPDEDTVGWEEYSKWTNADEAWLRVAEKYRTKPYGGYSRITNDTQARQAINEGHSIFTAMNWYSAMNRPYAPDFWLRFDGSYVGGHAIQYDAVRPDRFCNLQTFGERYGDRGYAYTRNLMPNIIGGAYTEAHYPTELLADMVATYYSGMIVRDVTAPECYHISNNKKRHIKTIEEYIKLGGKHETVAKEILDIIPNA